MGHMASLSHKTANQFRRVRHLRTGRENEILRDDTVAHKHGRLLLAVDRAILQSGAILHPGIAADAYVADRARVPNHHPFANRAHRVGHRFGIVRDQLAQTGDQLGSMPIERDQIGQ